MVGGALPVGITTASSFLLCPFVYIPLVVVFVASLKIFFFPEENLDIFSISSTVTGRGLPLVSGRSKTANPDTMANKAHTNPGIQGFILAYKILLLILKRLLVK